MTLDVYWANINPPLTEQEKEGWAFSVGVNMLACGMSHLKTDADVIEMHTRVTMYSRLNGAPIFCNGRGEDCNTLAFWFRWKGVSVNGSRKLFTTWIAGVASDAYKQERRAVERQVQQQREVNNVRAE